MTDNNWVGLFIDFSVVGVFAFVFWINKLQRAEARQEWDKQFGPLAMHTTRERTQSGNDPCGSASSSSSGGSVQSWANRPASFDFGKLHDGYSSAYGSGYSGPSVNTNGAPMCGSTDIYGNSFGASASSSSSINRWD